MQGREGNALLNRSFSGEKTPRHKKGWEWPLSEVSSVRYLDQKGGAIISRNTQTPPKTQPPGCWGGGKVREKKRSKKKREKKERSTTRE